MDNVKINLNGIEMNITLIEDRITIKPITDISNLKGYSFSMQKDSTIEYFITKLDSVSKSILEHYCK